MCILLCSFFQLLESGFKVEGWLSRQNESETISLRGRHQSVQLVNTWTLDHVQADPTSANVSNSFTVSDSGVIGISCVESPSLSVMYPDTDKPPVILSNTATYSSATFVKVSKKEYLAASCNEDSCLYLWDIESKTSKKVFGQKLPSEQRSNYMNIFEINGNSIGYGEATAAPDGSRSVFILKKDPVEMIPSGILRLFTPNDIWDMCYISLQDLTACLLLCMPSGPRVMMVEMDDGRTRWEVGKQQMGEEFYPGSICTDDNDTIYVADYGQDKIHLLSATDGTVIKWFDLFYFLQIQNIFTVRFHDQHLYIERKIHTENVQKYTIMKCKQIEDT